MHFITLLCCMFSVSVWFWYIVIFALEVVLKHEWRLRTIIWCVLLMLCATTNVYLLMGGN